MSFQDSLQWTRDVLTQWRHWTRAHWRITLVLSAMAFVIGWAWNTYAMAVGLEGSEAPEGTKTTATADGHTFNAVFWLILFTLISGVVTYAWTRGWTAFRADVAVLPRRFAEAMSSSRWGAFAMLLWGAAVALVIATLISSVVAIALGLALLALSSTPIGVILNFALIRVWRGLCGIIAPKGGPPVIAMISPFMVMIGEAVGLLLDGVIDSWVIKLLLGLVAAAVSVALARGAVPPKVAMILAVAGAVVAWQVIRVRGAYADDGGWSECVTADGRPCAGLGLGGVLAWLRSDGAGHVLARGSIGALFAALGALLGLGLGGAAASLAHSTSTGGRIHHAGSGKHRPPQPRVPESQDLRWPPRRPHPTSPPIPEQTPSAPPEPPSRHPPDRQSEPRPEPHPRPPERDPQPQPDPLPQSEPGHEPGRLYRSRMHGAADSDRGQVYRSASAGYHVPEQAPGTSSGRGVHPIPHPPASGPATPAHPLGHGRGHPWDDIDDFLPDPPERPHPPHDRKARQGDDDPGDAGQAGRNDDDPDGGRHARRRNDDPGGGHRPRPPFPPRRP